MLPGSAAEMLADLDILPELSARPCRRVDHDREGRALASLASEMAANPHRVLQILVGILVDLCDAGSAAVSLLDDNHSVYRWEATAGVFAATRDGQTPRHASPSEVCVARNATQLLHLPDRCFPAMPTEPRFIEVLLVPFCEQGRPCGAVWLVSHDFARRFSREDERIARELSQLASAGWHLWKASEAMAADGRSKDDFIATLAHELRNPLAAMVAAASLLQEQRGEDPREAHAVEVIDRQSHRIARLVDDLLDVARIATGKLHLERQDVDIRTVVAEAIEDRRSQIESRRQVVTVDLGPDPIVVDADPVRLAQVVSNLVDNAAKYTPEQGRIFVAAASEDEEAILTVRDTGAGISSAETAVIFEPFTQFERARLSSAGGLGLGLALVRRLTELHGGTVHAVGEPNRGSCFTIRLPIRRRPGVAKRR